MTSITASNILLTELGPLTQVTEILSPNGAVLGYFAPATTQDDSLYQEAARGIDPSEIARRKQLRESGFSIEEVLGHLRSLESVCPGP